MRQKVKGRKKLTELELNLLELILEILELLVEDGAVSVFGRHCGCSVCV